MFPVVPRSARVSVVTGGAGFIGSHLVDVLVARGDRVVVIDDLSAGRRAFVNPEAELLVFDVAEASHLRRLSLSLGPATWYHLAAQVDVRRSMADPIEDACRNLLGTISVLEAARATDSPVVFTSTAGGIYGADAPRPTTELAPPAPLSPHDASKLAAEGYLATFASLHGMRTSVLRLANVYGARQDPRAGSGVVAIFAGCLRERRPATIFGAGRQARDFVHVGDVVAAIVAAGARIPERGASRCWNIGTGEATSIIDLWSRMQAVAGMDLGAVHAPGRTGEPEHGQLDPSLARIQLEVPLDTPLEAGLSITLASFGVVPVLDEPSAVAI